MEEKGPSISQFMGKDILKGTKTFSSTFCIQRGLTQFYKLLENEVILVLGYLRHYSNLEKLAPVLISMVLSIFIFSFRAFNYYSKNEGNELFWSNDSGNIRKQPAVKSYFGNSVIGILSSFLEIS